MAGASRLVIEAGKAEAHYWRDLWRYRELFWFLSWRDVLVRYKQTAIGAAWALARPFLTMVVFHVIFSSLAKLPSEGGAPYPIMVFAGLLPWQLFASALAESGASLVGNASLISKVYFPRVIVPASSVLTSCFDFLVSGAIMAGLMFWYGFFPGARLAALPLFVGLALAAALGGGLWLTALNVRYRDVRYVIPFLVQFGLYVSPVGFSSGLVPERWRLLYSLNPLVGIIDGFRWALLGDGVELYAPGLALSLLGSALLLASGVWYFRRTERGFADVI